MNVMILSCRGFNHFYSSEPSVFQKNNNLSDPAQVTCGVPQGSIVGPSLLLVLTSINDLPLSLTDATVVDLYALTI